MTDRQKLVNMVYDALKEQGLIEPIPLNDIIVTRNKDNPLKLDNGSNTFK